MAKGITLQELDPSAIVNLVPHLGTTSNNGDAYSITTDVPIDVNQKFTIRFNAASSTAPTLSINNGTAVPIKKPNGNNAKLYASVYTLFKDGSSFILQGEGGEYGTATASDVRAGKSIGTENGLVIGNLPVRATGPTTINPTTSDQVLQSGIYDGTITVKAGGRRYTSGNTYSNGWEAPEGYVMIRGLTFKPSIVYFINPGSTPDYYRYGFITSFGFENMQTNGYGNLIVFAAGSGATQHKGNPSKAYLTSDGFNISENMSSGTYYWSAWE